MQLSHHILQPCVNLGLIGAVKKKPTWQVGFSSECILLKRETQTQVDAGGAWLKRSTCIIGPALQIQKLILDPGSKIGGDSLIYAKTPDRAFESM